MTAEAPMVVPRHELWLRGACLTMGALATLPGLELLSWTWDRSEYLAHAYLIPGVSALLLYRQRAAIAAALRAGSPPRSGPLWVGLAALFESAAVVGEVSTAAGVGIPMLLAATAHAVGGRRLLAATATPLALLVLMVPPPGFVQDRALMELKRLVMHVSVELLQAMGYTVAGIGNRILLPGHELFVADACSGLVSIVTLSPLAVVVAYFLGRGVWRRAVIVLSIFPLAIIGNVVRVTLTVALVSTHGIGAAEGVLHESFGLVTFLLGTLLLIGVAKVVD